MQPDTLRTLSLLEHMRDASAYIVAKANHQSFETYHHDRDLQFIVERNFEIIGEAMGRLSKHDPQVASRISHSREIIGLRNVLIHAYDDVDPVRIWQAVQQDLPMLLTELQAIMDSLTSSGDRGKT